MVDSIGRMRPSAADCQPPGSRATPSSYACLGTTGGGEEAATNADRPWLTSRPVSACARPLGRCPVFHRPAGTGSSRSSAWSPAWPATPPAA